MPYKVNYLLSKREELHQPKQNRIILEQLVFIKLTKLEMQDEPDEQFKKTILETKLKSEAQERMITFLHFLLTQHYSQCYKHQKQLILNHIKQCRAMISDLNYVLKVLPPTTTPTLEECQRQIRRWEEELKTTNEKAALYRESCQKVFTNLYIGIYTPFPEPIDLPTQGFQLRDILRYSSHVLVNSMIRDQQFYQQQYAAWHNYGRYQPRYQYRGFIATTPYSYNRHHESKPDQIIDNASKHSDKSANSFANNNWLVPAKISADLKRLQAETQFVRKCTKLKPADLSKQPHVHNQRDNIKHQLPAVKSSNINLQPGPSTIKDYSPEYQSSQNADLSHFNWLKRNQIMLVLLFILLIF